jgi:hypothetical protein
MANDSDGNKGSGRHEGNAEQQSGHVDQSAASISSSQEYLGDVAGPSAASNELNLDVLVVEGRQRKGAKSERRALDDEASYSSGQQQQSAGVSEQAPPSNELNFDALVIRERQQKGASTSGDESRHPPRAARPKPPGMDGMADFGSGVLGANLPVLQLNLDRLLAGRQDRIVHAHHEKEQEQQDEEQQQPSSSATIPKAPPSPSSGTTPADIQQQQQQQQQQSQRKQHRRDSRRAKQQQQRQQQQQEQRDPGPSQPRPHPFYLRPQHIKTNYKCPTSDGWMLHIVRTKQLGQISTRVHPVVLCPGLGSSGAYSFDLSPDISLADYLASKGWDVWTVELRGRV